MTPRSWVYHGLRRLLIIPAAPGFTKKPTEPVIVPLRILKSKEDYGNIGIPLVLNVSTVIDLRQRFGETDLHLRS